MERGLIEPTPANLIDCDRIRLRIEGLAKRFGAYEIAIDRWNATQIATQRQSHGPQVVPVGRGYGDTTAPTKELERLVVSRRLRHGGKPVLRWMASHVSVETDAAGN